MKAIKKYRVTDIHDYKLFLFLLFFSIFVILPFVYRTGMGEPDGILYASGVLKTVLGEYGGRYGNIFGPIYYPTMAYFLKVFSFRVGSYIFVQNIFGCFAASITVPLVFLLLRQRFDKKASFLGALLLLFSPTFWETGTYGHPHNTAYALSIAGGILVTLFAGGEKSIKQYLYFFAGITLTVTGLLYHYDVVLSFGWLTIYPLINSKNYMRQFLLAVTCYVLSILLTYFIQTQAMNIPYVLSAANERFYGGVSYFGIYGIFKGAVIIILGLGIATTCLSLIATWNSLKIKNVIIPLIVVTGAILPFLFWAKHPISASNARHYIFCFLPLIIAIITSLKFRRLFAGLGSIIALNVILAWLVYPLFIALYDNPFPYEFKKHPKGSLYYVLGDPLTNHLKVAQLQKELFYESEAWIKNTKRPLTIVAGNPNIPNYFLELAKTRKDYIKNDFNIVIRKAREKPDQLEILSNNPPEGWVVVQDRYKLPGDELLLSKLDELVKTHNTATY